MSNLLLPVVVFTGFALFIALMAVGVIFSNRSIKGSCGGLNNMKTEDGETFCELCGAESADVCRKDDPKFESQFGAF